MLSRSSLFVVALALPLACQTDPGSDTDGPGDSGNNPSTSDGTAATNNDTTNDDTGGQTPDPPGLGGECPVGEAVGHFDVILEESYSAIDGEIRGGLVQTTIITEQASQDGCRLLKRENPFCDPPCGGGEACSNTETCVTFPERIEVGTVTISGLEVPVSMEPAADKRYFLTELPHPAIAPGAEIELAADGISMTGNGFGALSLMTTDLVVVEAEPLDIAWTSEDGEASVRIEVNIDQHGISPTTLFCDVPDTGSFAIPAELIDSLMNAGVSGFPSANIYRQTIDSTTIDAGCVEFRVRARTQATVEVDGHVACFGDMDCPEGQTCNVPIQTCQ